MKPTDAQPTADVSDAELANVLNRFGSANHNGFIRVIGRRPRMTSGAWKRILSPRLF